MEMSIVLVIVGLIIGGVLVGADMIRNAELQQIISDVNRFKSAIKTFKEKYSYYPGDFPEAEEFWGTDTTCPDGNTSNFAPRTTTCNGDGNGMVVGPRPISGSDFFYNSPDVIGTLGSIPKNYLEALRAWQHLTNAGLLKGSYSGIIASGNRYSAGTNVPEGPRGTDGYAFFYSPEIFSTAAFRGPPFVTSDMTTVVSAWPSVYGHIIEYGQINSVASVAAGVDMPALTRPEARSIDQKIDDGTPGSGNVLSFSSHNNSSPPTNSVNPNSGNCASVTIPSGGNYEIPGIAVYGTDNPTAILCALIFITGF
jgi:hypothetical protein